MPIDHMHRLLFPIAIVTLAGWQLNACAAVEDGAIYSSDHHDFRIEMVFRDLEHPWSLAFLPDGRMLVTEKPGRLNLLDPGSGGRSVISGVPEVAAISQGGLLDIVLHPDFEDNGQVYLSYSAEHDGGLSTHVGRGRLVDDRLEDFEVLFRAEPGISEGRHFGSRLVFDREGYLFITVGDHGQRDSAQDRNTHMGTVIRLTDEGEVPDDNPFVDEPDVQPEIYSYGHRNPQGMTLHPQTGMLWLHEHGPRGGDEINLPKAGLNYGWPKTTFGREYFGPRIGPEPPQPGFEPPVHHWTPSIAPSGMAFYDGDRFPDWHGDLFVGALAHQHLQRLRFDEDNRVTEQERLLTELDWRIRDVRSGPDGYLYVLPDKSDGALMRLVPVDQPTR